MTEDERLPNFNQEPQSREFTPDESARAKAQQSLIVTGNFLEAHTPRQDFPRDRDGRPRAAKHRLSRGKSSDR